MDEGGSASAARFVDIFGHAVPGDVHLSQPPEDLFGAGVVVLRNETLELGYQRLGFGVSGGAVADGAELRENIHQRVAGGLHGFRGLAGGLLLEFPVGVGPAPFGPGLGGVVFHLLLIEGFEIHIHHSCFLNLTGVGDELIQMRPLQLQQFDLLL